MARETNIPLSEWRKKERALLAKRQQSHPPHECFEHAEYVEFEGALGQAYYCGICGELLQVG